MAGVLASDEARDVRAALHEVLSASPHVPQAALAAFGRLIDVLESHDDAVVFAADATLTTEQAAAVLGVSRMTVVRLVDRGELPADGAVHRKISVSALAHYQEQSSQRRRSALTELAAEINDGTTPDQVIETR